jgi:hypothetical protein
MSLFRFFLHHIQDPVVFERCGCHSSLVSSELSLTYNFFFPMFRAMTNLVFLHAYSGIASRTTMKAVYFVLWSLCFLLTHASALESFQAATHKNWIQQRSVPEKRLWSRGFSCTDLRFPPLSRHFSRRGSIFESRHALAFICNRVRSSSACDEIWERIEVAARGTRLSTSKSY